MSAADHTLTDAERELLMPVLWTETARARMLAAVESILTARLATAEAEKEALRADV